MLSKMVTDRLKANDSVREALRQLGPQVGDRAKALLGSYLKKGEEMPDLALLSELLERMLASRAQGMETADSKHNDELADDAEPRAERDEASGELYAQVVDIKQSTAKLFGDTWVTKLGFPAEIPQDPGALARLAGEIKKALGEAKLPKPRIRGVKSFDVDPWIEDIDKPLKRLKKALGDVQREAREGQTTLIAKTRAVAAYDEGFSTGTSFAGALLRLVGEKEHAERLRPSAKRPGTLETEEESEPVADEPEKKPE
jgi:hypothetical protein